MTVRELQRMRAWAEAKAESSAEPPWARHLHAKLRETIDALLAGMAATEPVRAKESRIRLVASNEKTRRKAL